MLRGKGFGMSQCHLAEF